MTTCARPATRSFALLLLLAASPALAAASASSFPRKLGAPIERAVLAVEAGAAGEPHLVVVAGTKVLAFAPDGKPVKGFPVDVGAEDAVVGELAAGDLDGDKRPDVAWATQSGKLFVVQLVGAAPLAGFPLTLEGGASAGPSFGDLDGDGRLELLQGDRAGRLHALRAGGGETAGFPVTLGQPVTSSASVGRLKGARAIAVGTESGAVHVLDGTGKPLEGFPLTTGSAVKGLPAFGDLDDDGRVDLAVTSTDFKIYAVNDAGEPLAGFPVATGLGIHAGPALADLDDDGALDLAVASSDGSLYALSGGGKALPGFPLELGPTLLGGVVVADVDRDGKLDLVVAATDGKVHALSAVGKPVAGFPARFTGMLSGTPTLTPVRRSPDLHVLVGSPDGTWWAVRHEARAPTGVASAPWPTVGRDGARSGAFGPHPARYKALVLSPTEPKIADSLKASWRFLSADGGAEPATPVIQWLRDDKPVKELAGKREVPARAAKKNERWRYEVTAGTRVFKGPEVRIADTPPTLPEVRIEPPVLSRRGPAKVIVTKPSTDDDGLAVSYRFSWLADGRPTGVTTDTVPADKLKKGQRWTAIVSGFDGTLEGARATLEAPVVNSAPTAPQLRMEPAAPRRGEAVSTVIASPATDLDSDTLSYRYRWTLGGKPLNYSEQLSALPSEAGRKGERVSLTVAAFDGEVEGPSTTVELARVNTAPTAPRVAITPAAPKVGQPLRLVVLAGAADPDGDPLRYRTTWMLGGQPVPRFQDAAEVPGAEVRKGGQWSVQVTAHDGEVDSPPARAEARVGNAPPSQPLIALCTAPVPAGAAITARITTPATDPDGDAVTYKYEWTLNGKAMGAWSGRQALGPGDTKKADQVQLTVTATDGVDSGRAAAAGCAVEDTAPRAPGIAFEPAEPTAGSGLAVKVTQPAPDHDGDKVTYRYAWTKNGAPLATTGDGAKVPAGAVRHGDRLEVQVWAHDGERDGERVSSSVVVRNTPPALAGVTVTPAQPKVGDALACALSGKPQDADGETVSVRYAWFVDGAPSAVASDAAQLPAGIVRKHQTWRCEAWVDDGTALSERRKAEVKVKNTPPPAPVVALEPVKPRTDEDLFCRIAREAADLDGDPVRYEYKWTRDGKAFTPGADPTRIPADQTRRGERWGCTAVGSDGEQPSPGAVAEATVVNSPPGGAVAKISPESAAAGTSLKCEVAAPVTDPDGDTVRYELTWLKNGVAQAGTGAELSGRYVKADDLWSCRIQATDGQLASSPTESAAVAVKPPEKNVVAR